ncbi:Inhibitor of growth protein 3 [Blomia tropicalis]|nr:Inhibitor of growth protein 3 [Blomia tropicalis]
MHSAYELMLQYYDKRGIKYPRIPYDYRRNPFAHGNHVFSREHRQLEPLYYRARVSAMIQPGFSSYAVSEAGATVDEIANAIKHDIADIRERHDRGEQVEHVFFVDEHRTRAKVVDKWSETGFKPKRRSTHRPWTHIKASRKAAIEEQRRSPYCYCGTRRKPPLIRCDNRRCQNKWYHLECVGITDVPTDGWHCILCMTHMRFAKHMHLQHSRGNIPGPLNPSNFF